VENKELLAIMSAMPITGQNVFSGPICKGSGLQHRKAQKDCMSVQDVYGQEK
jgi:hypothetical protein